MDEAVRTLIRAGLRLQCSIEVRIRALVLYHHFTRSSSQKAILGHNDIMVAAAALKCAARYEEYNISYDAIANEFYSIVNNTSDFLHTLSTEYIAIKKSLITVDNIMQRKLEYVFCHRLAHEFLFPFLSFIFERNHKLAPFHQPVSTTCMRFANDAYVDPQSLNYKPDHLAIACIHAALHVYGLLKELDFLEPWFQAFSRDLSVSKLREIKIFLFRLYDNIDERVEEDEYEVIDSDEMEMEEVQENPEGEQEMVTRTCDDEQERETAEKQHERQNVDEQGEHELETSKGDKREQETSTKRHKDKHEHRGRRKRKESKRQHEGRSKRRHKEGGKRRRNGSKNKHKKKRDRRIDVEDGQEPDPDSSSKDKNLSPIDLQLSAWTERFRAARYFNSSVTENET